MSYDERQKEKELRKEAKDKTEAEKDPNFRYLVRGPQWDRKIVRVKSFKAKGMEANEPILGSLTLSPG
ncbi:hypothetical protein DPMN_137505 [Dreissena polymorpha]|nr:hypothetical protein DPMN_137505 [Dreissena polymorpha]